MSDFQLKHVLQQVKKAKTELSEYPPSDFDWNFRAKSTCESLVPWLVSKASDLRNYVDDVMNSPFVLRNDISELFKLASKKSKLNRDQGYRGLRTSVESALQHEKMLLAQAGGTVVSKLIERFLISVSEDWTMASNGASDYPDLFLSSNDYSGLPDFRRGKDQVYGAAVKGKMKRPVRIPDGLEIKTCKGTFAVDCHHAHAGLHIVLLFEKSANKFATQDIQIGFMRRDLYRITVPSTPTTTLKASFNRSEFVSLFSQDAKNA